MTTTKVARRSVAGNLSDILASSSLPTHRRAATDPLYGPSRLPVEGDDRHGAGEVAFALPTWTRTVALVTEHAALAAVIAPDGESLVRSCYRFTAKLREHTDLLEGCIANVLKELKKRNPVLGWDVAIDASDMPAYANGQRFVSGGRERSDDGSPTRTPPGGTARRSPHGRVRLLWLPAAHGGVLQDGPSLGMAGGRPACRKRRPSRRCSTGSRRTGSIQRRARWTRATTTTIYPLARIAT